MPQRKLKNYMTIAAVTARKNRDPPDLRMAGMDLFLREERILPKQRSFYFPEYARAWLFRTGCCNFRILT